MLCYVRLYKEPKSVLKFLFTSLPSINSKQVEIKIWFYSQIKVSKAQPSAESDIV